MKLYPGISLRAVTLAVLLAGPGALASGGQPPGDEGQIVRLSAFEVSAGNTEGYAASGSISGTRIRAEIKELPFNVNVVTSEFIKDFDKFEMGDALSFTSSVSSNDITPSAVNLRGFNALDMSLAAISKTKVKENNYVAAFKDINDIMFITKFGHPLYTKGWPVDIAV